MLRRLLCSNLNIALSTLRSIGHDIPCLFLFLEQFGKGQDQSRIAGITSTTSHQYFLGYFLASSVIVETSFPTYSQLDHFQ